MNCLLLVFISVVKQDISNIYKGIFFLIQRIVHFSCNTSITLTRQTPDRHQTDTRPIQDRHQTGTRPTPDRHQTDTRPIQDRHQTDTRPTPDSHTRPNANRTEKMHDRSWPNIGRSDVCSSVDVTEVYENSCS